MDAAAAPLPLAIVGRAAELEQLGTILAGAAAGQFGMVVVSGEPGVGKTALFGALAAQVADSTSVLAGACPPLTSLSVPFLPLISAVRAWMAERPETDPHLEFLSGNAAEVVLAFDAWVDRRCAERPTLLVIDDLHWADESTLDVLTYLLAGPSDRRLTVVLTVRESELHPGHRLHRWMADAVRMPRLTLLRLEPLDRLGVAEQIAGILGRPARESLVDDVVQQSRGNPYLTRLLVEPLPPDATTLPSALPATLADAVLRSWHALTPAARALTQLLAVGGPHLRSVDIGPVAAATLGEKDVVPLLREAVEAGLITVHDDGSYWFRHPLQPELLESAALPEQRRDWHATYAALLEEALEPRLGTRSHGGQLNTVETLVAIADHYASTDHLDRAYRAAERAAEAVGSIGGAAEQLRLLNRALALLPHADAIGETRSSLLRKICAAAERAGKQEEELAAIDLLLEELDPVAAPLDVAVLLVRRTDLRLSTGREFAGLDDVHAAVQLSAGAPQSWQHAYALAELAHSELWHDSPTGAAHAEAAVVAARAAGEPRSLAYALTAQSMAMTVARMPGGGVPAEEAVQAAAAAGDFWAFCHAALWSANAEEASTSRAFVSSLRKRGEQLVSLGAPHTYVGWLGSSRASGLLSLGDWRECRRELRVALGASPGPMGEVTARLVAAQLAVLQGRQAEAEAHLYRAEELYAETSGFLAFEFDAVRAEVALGAGDPRRALGAALTGARTQGLPPTQCEYLLPLAARALADLAVLARDEHRSDAELLGELDQLRQEFPQVIADVGAPTPLYDLQLAALQSVYEAEIGRAHRAPDAGDSWLMAADLCRRGELPWREAYALWRAAEANLPVRARRVEGIDALRRGRHLAADLEAVPLQRALDGLARSVRVVLEDATGEPEPGADVGRAWRGETTPREREVWALVAAGRTYGDIARTLHISEKTVSVHISNLLRKTGATNRIELASLAQREAARSGRPVGER